MIIISNKNHSNSITFKNLIYSWNNCECVSVWVCECVAAIKTSLGGLPVLIVLVKLNFKKHQKHQQQQPEEDEEEEEAEEDQEVPPVAVATTRKILIGCSVFF